MCEVCKVVTNVGQSWNKLFKYFWKEHDIHSLDSILLYNTASVLFGGGMLDMLSFQSNTLATPSGVVCGILFCCSCSPFLTFPYCFSTSGRFDVFVSVLLTKLLRYWPTSSIKKAEIIDRPPNASVAKNTTLNVSW